MMLQFNKKHLAVLSILLIATQIESQTKFCNNVNSNMGPQDFPTLPDEFQTRVEINVIDQSISYENTVYFDRWDQSGELLTRNKDSRFRLRLKYRDNELFTIKDGECQVKPLNTSEDKLMFGIMVNDVNVGDPANPGINMKPSSYFFHFNNGYPHEKVGPTTRRGIPVIQYRSCQDWPELNANVMINYYFSAPGYKNPVDYFPDLYPSLPVACTVEGYVYGTNNQQRSIKREYNYFEFRKLVENKPELNVLPSKVYCEGRKTEPQFYQMPESFSFYHELVNERFKDINSHKVFYSYTLKALRVNNDLRKTKIVQDFYSGVGYVIDEFNQCGMYAIGLKELDFFDETDLVIGDNTFTTIQKPNDVFQLDETYYYVGKRFERGLLCNVFASKRESSNLLGNSVQADYFVYEYYFLEQTYDDESSDKQETMVPISLHISAAGTNFSIINHFYDFDSQLHKSDFDISQCFNGKDKIRFGIRFNYPEGISESLFTQFFTGFYSNGLVEIAFDKAIAEAVSVYSASPLRFSNTLVQAFKQGFVVYSTLLNFPEPIFHFKFQGNPKINTAKAKRAEISSSALNCAAICLGSTIYSQPVSDFKCASYDVCPTPDGHVICAFYETTSTDPNVIDETQEECTHLSKTSSFYDSADVLSLYRLVEESVVRKNFKLDLKDRNNDSITVASFLANDIFQTTITQTGHNGMNGGPILFLQRFVEFGDSLDLDEAFIGNSTKEILVRQKLGVSLSECARLCLFEPSFTCALLTYNEILLDCKWCSLPYPRDADDDNTGLITTRDNYKLFVKDPLYNYIEYPFKVTSVFDSNQPSYLVTDAAQCAHACDAQTKISCRSFNLCQQEAAAGGTITTFNCIMSETNVHNTEKDPNLVTTVLCSHYSKKAESDFTKIPKTQLNTQPQSQLYNTSVEECAETCVLEISYFCRSFDFFSDSRKCQLYKENVKDSLYVKISTKPNEMCAHYSRSVYEKDGKIQKIEAVKPDSEGDKFSGGTIFGITLSVIIGGFLLGVMCGFVYLKVTKKTSSFFPVMTFSNPNFKKEQN